jgi:nucleotide-binding universal stress UspA family protein
MVEIRRVLCPVDFSDTSRHAFDHAIAIARWYESQIVALHVIPREVLPPPPSLFAEVEASSATAGTDRETVDALLRAWVELAHEEGLKTETVVDEGSPAARIVANVSILQADLVVIGTHGLSGVDRFMLGSVAEKVLRRAPCPVLTVPPRVATSAKVPYTRLLCPVDFSDSSSAALRFALSLAEEADAHLTVLHVLDWPSENDLLVERFDDVEFRKRVEEDARKRLEALVPDEARVWCKPATKVAYGKAYRQILEVAESDGIDLIVIGVHGRNPVDLTLFGSTTNHVVRRAPCPVLTLKS